MFFLSFASMASGCTLFASTRVDGVRLVSYMPLAKVQCLDSIVLSGARETCAALQSISRSTSEQRTARPRTRGGRKTAESARGSGEQCLQRLRVSRVRTSRRPQKATPRRAETSGSHALTEEHFQEEARRTRRQWPSSRPSSARSRSPSRRCTSSTLLHLGRLRARRASTPGNVPRARRSARRARRSGIVRRSTSLGPGVSSSID